MSMIVNLDGSAHELPDYWDFRRAIEELESNEDTISEFADDPLQWIGLLSAVGNFLYHTDEDFFLDQLRGHFAAIVGDIVEQYCDDETDEDEGDDE